MLIRLQDYHPYHFSDRFHVHRKLHRVYVYFEPYDWVMGFSSEYCVYLDVCVPVRRYDRTMEMNRLLLLASWDSRRYEREQTNSANFWRWIRRIVRTDVTQVAQDG